MVTVRWYMLIAVAVIFLFSLSPTVSGQESSPVDTSISNKVFLPVIQYSSNHRYFEWRLDTDGVSAASVDSLNEFGQEWIMDRLADCDNIDSASVSEVEKEGCEKLQYTIDGNFTQKDLEKIKANGGYLIRVSEGSILVNRNEEVSAAAYTSGTAWHGITLENITAATVGNWWQSFFNHNSWGGTCCNTSPTQYNIYLKGLAWGSVNYYQEFLPVYSKDNNFKPGPDVGSGNTGYSVATIACYFASNGVQEQMVCANSGQLNY